MTSPPDEHVSRSGAPVQLERGAARDDASHGGAHARRLEVPPVEASRHPVPDRRRYFLSSFEPSGDFDAVIVAVTHDGRRRYFTTRDGARLTEVDEVSFERRRESGTRSMLELDERELGELEVELQFVRPVRGRDPIAEAEHEAEAAIEPEPDAVRADEAEPEAVAADDAEAEAAAADEAEPEKVAADDADADAEYAEYEAEVDFEDEAVAEFEEPTPADDASDASADSPPERVQTDTATDAEPAEEPEADPDPDPDPDPPILHRATFTPPEDTTEEATDEWATGQDEEDDEDEDEDEDGVDPVTEEFEEMVMASTTMTFERVDDAASVAHAASGIDEAEDDAPTLSPASLSATEAIAQVSLAKGIAFIAHRGKHDRSGAPYIDHPGRIAERFDPVTQTVEAAAAWLHDVLEDTPITAQELFEAGVMPQIIDVVQLLTRTPDVTPDEYYAAIRRDPMARRVKLADIDDNTARWRLRRLDYDTQLRLVEKYRYARQALGND